MPNQYVNKVVYGGSTIIDLTSDTVTPAALMQGYTAHDASGAAITGTSTAGTMVIRDTQDSLGGTVREITAGSVVTGTKTITANGTYDVAEYADALVNVPSAEPELQAKTATPTETQQTVTPDSGYDGLSSVTVGAISSTYVGSGITRRTSSDLTASGATVTVPSGYYQSQASKSVASGTAGTPTATKGSVSNHSVSVTPSVTNATGYITGGTVSGTAVSVSASELVSGNLAIAQNGTGIDVTNYETVSVNVSGGEDVNYARTVSRSGAITSIPNVTSIGDYAYYGCTELNVSSLPSGLASIGQYAFQNCTSLALTSLPSSCTDVGYYAFYGCSNLALTSLPSGMTTIKSHAFDGCARLALTSLPSGVTSIQQYAFRTSGIALTSLPSSCTTIDTYAFQGCRSLALTSLPSGITSIASNAFQTCTSLALTSLPSTVTSIGTSAFHGCTGITTISCDGALTTISSGAFGGNATYPSNLVSASFPNATVSSWASAFGSSTSSSACLLLETVDIGNSSAISAGAFQNCQKLQTLVLRKTSSICTLANVSAFTNTPMRGYGGLSGTVYVPSDLISTYQTATNWSTVYSGGYLTFAAIEGSEYEL